MIKFLFFVFFFSVFQLSVMGQPERKASVGDIAFDASTDDPKFQFCNPDFILQGYELKSKTDESRKWISSQLLLKYVYQSTWKVQSGFITVRFAVNCLGLTDRFRAMAVSTDLQATVFPVELTQQLIQLVKAIKWPVETYRMQAIDYYQDVTFKIVNGQLIEALL